MTIKTASNRLSSLEQRQSRAYQMATIGNRANMQQSQPLLRMHKMNDTIKSERKDATSNDVLQTIKHSSVGFTQRNRAQSTELI